MKHALFGVLLMAIIFIYAQDTLYREIVDMDELNIIRAQYYDAVENRDEAYELLLYIEDAFGRDYNQYNPIIRAYYACLVGLRGKFHNNPYTKFSFVSDGVKKIDSAVEQFPNCLEIRFLRFSFYHYLPDLFGIDKRRDDDLSFIINAFGKMDYVFVPVDIQIDMIKFTRDCGRVDNETRNMLNDIIVDLLNAKQISDN